MRSTGRKFPASIVFLSFLALLCGIAGAQQAGTWKLNVAKSTFTADHSAPKSLTLTIIEQGDNMIVDVAGEAMTGEPIRVHFDAKLDGTEAAATGLPGGAETVSLTRINANTVESVSKKGGEVVTTVRSVVSPDGKTRTSTWSAKDAKGNPETWVTVYDRQ